MAAIRFSSARYSASISGSGPLGAVQDDGVTAGHARRDVLQAHDGRDAHRAHDDGRVAGQAAGVHGHADDLGPGEIRALGGREVVGDEDRGLGELGEILPGLPDQVPQEPSLDVPHVLVAFPQELVLHLQKPPLVAPQGLADGVGGRELLLADGLGDLLAEAALGEHAVVEVEDGGDIPAELLGGGLAEVVQLGQAVLERLAQQLQFRLDLLVGDVPVGDPVLPGVQDEGGGDGHAGRNRDAFLDLHGPRFSAPGVVPRQGGWHP
jgi:hypothetical protein